MIPDTLDLESLYETEYDRWLTATIELLKERQFDRLDRQHLIEELEASRRSEKSAVKNLLLQIIIHLLLYQFWKKQQARNRNHWAGEIITFRVQLEDKLTINLRNLLAIELESIYQNARLIVQKKTGLDNLPVSCPYPLDRLLDKPWFPS